MDLRELFGSDAPSVEVTALAYDNSAVEPGTAFFCVRGFTRDGHELAPDAVARGAAALVVDHPLGLGVPEVVVPDVRAAMAPAAARLAGDPPAEPALRGLTRTHGKPTPATARRWRPTARRGSGRGSTRRTPRCAGPIYGRARTARTSRSTGSRSTRRCPGASTSSTRWSRSPPRGRWASRMT